MGTATDTGAARTVKYFDIEEPLANIRRWRTNADYLAQDIIDEYFGPAYDSKEKLAMYLTHDYERNTARMDMLYEALYQIRLSLAELDKALLAAGCLTAAPHEEEN